MDEVNACLKMEEPPVTFAFLCIWRVSSKAVGDETGIERTIELADGDGNGIERVAELLYDSQKSGKSCLRVKGLDRAVAYTLNPRSGPLGKLIDEVLDDALKAGEALKAGVLVARKEEVIVAPNANGLDFSKETGVGAKKLDKAAAYALKIAPLD
ncbi:hypothetical protein LWI29_009513 [Acer saccharum]|uniref:Uncharacterized protein n=1 Tax=Acer saccharum TaxID=4024 RepID=A0AA39V741_ACESA|nr:hypothetical protein LWI29_009513 [Acer saccharum]